MNVENNSTGQTFGPIDVTYRWADAYAVTFRSARSVIMRVAIFSAIFAAIFTLLPVILDGERLGESFRWFPWKVLAALAGFLLFFELGVLPLIGHVRGMRRMGKGGVRFMISAEGVEVKYVEAESLVYWASVKRVASTEDRLFLFIQQEAAFVLPKRAFRDQAAFDAAGHFAEAQWRSAHE